MTPITRATTAPIDPNQFLAQRTNRADLATERQTFLAGSDRNIRTDLSAAQSSKRTSFDISEIAQRKIRLVDAAERTIDQTTRTLDTARRIIPDPAASAAAEQTVRLAETGANYADLALNEAEAGEPVVARATLGLPDPIKMVEDAAKQLGRHVRLPGLAEMQANFGMRSGATLEHGDLNGDGRVGLDDFNLYATGIFDAWMNKPMKNALPSLDMLIANFGKQGMSMSQGDLNGDGNVDLADFNLFATSYNSTPAYEKPIPANAPPPPGFRTIIPGEHTTSANGRDSSRSTIAERIDQVDQRAQEQRARAVELREQILREDAAQKSSELLNKLGSRESFQRA